MAQKKKVKLAQKSGAKDKNPSKKYRYVMEVTEEVISTTDIYSDTPLDDDQLRAITEQRRDAGKLSFKEVRDVDIFFCGAYVNRKKV